jgi:hypothetical protein
MESLVLEELQVGNSSSIWDWSWTFLIYHESISWITITFTLIVFFLNQKKVKKKINKKKR